MRVGAGKQLGGGSKGALDRSVSSEREQNAQNGLKRNPTGNALSPSNKVNCPGRAARTSAQRQQEETHTMSKKLFIGLAPLVCIAAFVVMPTVAQSAEYYKNSFPAGKLAEGEKLPTIAWGTLTLTANLPSKAAPSTCENSSGGFAENSGGKGIGATDNFASWNCTNAGCPPGIVTLPTGQKVEKEFIVLAGPEIKGVDSPGTATYAGGSLPWPTELTGAAPEIRTESKDVVVVLACIAQKTAGIHALGGKENEPQYLAQPTVCFTTPVNKQEPVNTNGLNFGPSQSKVTFDSKSGHLFCKGPTEPEKPGEEIEFEGNTSGSLKAMGYKNSEILITK